MEGIRFYQFAPIPVEFALTGNFQIMYQNGEFHREDNGNLHREDDLPAVIWANGTQEWYRHGKKHRDTEELHPAYVGAVYAESRAATLLWYINDNLLPDTKVKARLQKRILSSNAKKTELLAAVAPVLPLDMGITICVYM